MNVLYIALFEQNAGWGAECFVNEAMVKNGVKTIKFDYRKNRDTIYTFFLNLDEDFDLVFLQRGDYFPLEILKCINRPMFFWASELVSRQEDQDDKIKSGLFEKVYVRTPACIETVVNRGWINQEKIEVLTSGFDPAVFSNNNDTIQDIDVLFNGTMTKRRKEILKELSKHFNVIIQNKFGKESSEFYNRSKVVLNIHAEDMLDTETRVFEVLGSGGFLISERLSAENPFQNGIHFIECGNSEDLVKWIGYYLNHEEERKKIAGNGFQEALNKHTWEIRAKSLINQFQIHTSGRLNLPAINKTYLKYFHKKKQIKNLFNRYSPIFVGKNKTNNN